MNKDNIIECLAVTINKWSSILPHKLHAEAIYGKDPEFAIQEHLHLCLLL